MKNQNKQPSATNFWFGFAAGSLGATAATYLLGTKRGRETLKKCITMAERLEENSPDFMDQIRTILNTITDTKPLELLKEELPAAEKKTVDTINSVERIMDKIKQVAQPKGYVKKFFAKSGKILKD